MKAIMVMFDSLNRHMLPPYGCDWTHAPNFRRLAERTVVFDKSYVCSMPCMPARRDLHTGRPNFLHSGWGPLEPFDDSMPAILRENGIHTHLATDHYHYLEDGGATYHHRYSSWEAFRGQEGDQWVGYAGKVEHPPAIGRNGATDGHATQEWVNRMVIKTEEQYPQTQTFAAGLEYIRRNHKFDNWFLQIETFDPHEPFRSPDKYHELYDDPYDGPIFDWPKYGRVTESPEEVHHMRMNYASLLSMCDNYLGKILDEMDRLDLWKDTMLIVWTDHGFMLGEKGWWAKGHPPM
jgi:arylsulfatase A-like enzyme